MITNIANITIIIIINIICLFYVYYRSSVCLWLSVVLSVYLHTHKHRAVWQMHFYPVACYFLTLQVGRKYMELSKRADILNQRLEVPSENKVG